MVRRDQQSNTHTSPDADLSRQRTPDRTRISRHNSTRTRRRDPLLRQPDLRCRDRPAPAERRLIRRADEILGTAGLLVRLLETAQATATRETLPEWFRPWADIEQAATKLRSYQPLVLDGLLQTPAYAHAMFQAGDPAADEDTLQRAVAARIDRQQIFNRPNPPRLITILEESVLHRPIGPTPEVMRNQLDHLPRPAAAAPSRSTSSAPRSAHTEA